MTLHTTQPPKLNFHHNKPQINLWCCISNIINIKDNNNNNNNVNTAFYSTKKNISKQKRSTFINNLLTNRAPEAALGSTYLTESSDFSFDSTGLSK